MLSLWGFVLLSPLLREGVTPGLESLACWVRSVFAQPLARQLLLDFPASGFRGVG